MHAHCTTVCFKWHKNKYISKKTPKNMGLEMVYQELTRVINSTLCPWGPRKGPCHQYTSCVPFFQPPATAMVNSTSPIYRNIQGVPWRSSGWDPVLLLPRAQVQSLVGELRSHKPRGTAQKEKKKKKKIYPTSSWALNIDFFVMCTFHALQM